LFLHFPLLTENPARDPLKAIPCLQRACENNHAPSCFNLAVLYNKGDTGVPKNPELFEKYKEKTTQLVELVGGLGGARTN
jgi:TPR repeat protein